MLFYPERMAIRFRVGAERLSVVVRHVGQVHERRVANQPTGYAAVELLLPRCRDDVRRYERPHFFAPRKHLAELVRPYSRGIVPSTEIVDNEHSGLKHVVDDIPSAVFEGIEQVGPVPEKAVQVADDVRAFDKLFPVSDVAEPTANRFRTMSFARAITASEDQESALSRRAPRIEAEPARLGFKLLELRMPHGFELQVLGVPACVWRLPRSPWDR